MFFCKILLKFCFNLCTIQAIKERFLMLMILLPKIVLPIVVHLWVKVENERRREMEGEIYTAQQCLILAKFNSMARVEFDIYTDQYE
jgi:hypothetical protein